MKKTDKRDWVEQIIDGVPEGMRHDSAVRLVGRWYGKGLCQTEVRLILFIWNRLNSPPLSIQELESIENSTKTWERPRTASVMGDEGAREIMRKVRTQMCDERR
ncbi:primase alpha helix C-terminal domain-containing protein [Chloroflexota bacterium]